MPTLRQPLVHIETAAIPEHVRLDLLSVIYDETVAYFQQPGVAEAFERWKAQKEKKAADAATRKE